jgi:hypothetical protein
MENDIELKTGEETNSNAPSCCIGCVRWEKFGKNCHYYWEGKKQCTMRANNWDEAAMQQ